MNRHAMFHLGHDVHGCCHRRMKDAAAVRRCRQHQALFPRVVWVVACSVGREVWRNGLHRRRWYAVAAMVRQDRRGFMTTLSHPPLVSPVTPRF